MKEITLLNKVKSLLGIEIKLAQLVLDDGQTLEADAFEAGAEVFILDANGEKVPAPAGSYVAGSSTVIVAMDGIIESIEKKEEEQLKADYITSADLLNVVNEINAKIDALKLSKQEPEKEKEVVLEADAKPLTHSPEKVEEVQKIKLQKNKSVSTRDVVFSKIFN